MYISINIIVINTFFSCLQVYDPCSHMKYVILFFIYRIHSLLLDCIHSFIHSLLSLQLSRWSWRILSYAITDTNDKLLKKCFPTILANWELIPFQYLLLVVHRDCHCYLVMSLTVHLNYQLNYQDKIMMTLAFQQFFLISNEEEENFGMYFWLHKQ